MSVLPEGFAPDGKVTIAHIEPASTVPPDSPETHEGLHLAGAVYSETNPPEKKLLAYGVPATVPWMVFATSLVSELCRLHENGAFDRDCLHDVLLRSGATDLKLLSLPH